MYVIGLDFGTTNLKALLYEADGNIVRQEAAPIPTHYNTEGFAEFHADEIFDRVLSLLNGLIGDFTRKQDIKAVSFASMAETGVALDRQGKPLAPAIAWFDRRTIGIAEQIANAHDVFKFFQITGMQLSHVPSLCKILWEKKYLPDIHQQTHRWIFLCNYLAYRLSGEYYTDPSQACRSMAFDIHTGKWSEEICAQIGIDPGLFPPVKEAGQPMGTLLSEIAGRLGLKRSVQVVLGGHDHLCGALSTGLKEKGILINSSGTVDSALTLIDASDIGRELFDLGVGCGRYFLPGTHYAMGGIQSAGRSVQWYADAFFPEIEEQIGKRVQKMNAETESVSSGSEGVLFIPHLRGSIVPHRMPAARGAFLGLRETHTRGHMARAVYEGLAMEYRLMVDRIGELLNTDFPDIRCFGGGSQNGVWIRVKANVLNRPMIVYESQENSCLGAAILAGLGCGLYKDLADAFQRIQHRRFSVEPDAGEALRYEPLFQNVYRPLFQHLREINDMIERHLSDAKE